MKENDKIKLLRFISPRGKENSNNFIVITEKGQYLISYQLTVVFQKRNGEILLDPRWNFSRATAKFRNKFLSEETAETRRKIESGEYKVVNLN